MADSLEEHSLKVVLPEEMQRFFCETGYAPTTALENRCNSRLRVRTEVPIWFTSLPNGLKNQTSRPADAPETALLKDISRTGVAILYHEQIFPDEGLIMQFNNRQFDVTVVRCRRIARACYEIGGIINSLITLETEDEE